jgi:hypothetical protein
MAYRAGNRGDVLVVRKHDQSRGKSRKRARGTTKAQPFAGDRGDFLTVRKYDLLRIIEKAYSSIKMKVRAIR